MTTTALTFPTGELARVSRTIPEQRTEPVPTEPAGSDVRQLVERAQGDGIDAGRAMAELYTRYRGTIERFVWRRTGSHTLMDDITAETFVRAMRRIRSFQWTGTDLGAWLVTIARNLIADYYKSGRYRLEVTTGDVLDSDRTDRDWVRQPETAVEHLLTSERIFRALAKLNEEQRQCLELRFLREYSVTETAITMRKTEGAVKSLQYRASAALAKILRAEGGA